MAIYADSFYEKAEDKFTKCYAEEAGYEVICNNRTGQENWCAPYENNVI